MNVTYDSRNRVVRRTCPTGTLNLTYSGWNLIEERNGGGELEQTYVHGAGTDELVVKITASGPAYYHHDGLGSTIALTGENGELLESYRYDAFGGVTVYDSSGSALPASPRGNRFLFTGREWLGQAGIYDYRNRVYSAQIGRFLQTDPIRFQAGDINIYRYVGNGPVNWRDPDGLKIWPLSGPIHGNWCGGDWTGGQHDEYRDGTGPGYYKDPTDALDAACKKHDKCYYKCRQKYPCDKVQRKKCMEDCNLVLHYKAYSIGTTMGLVVGFAMNFNPDPGPNAPFCKCHGGK